MFIVVTENHQKQLFYSSKTPFPVVEFSYIVTFKEMLGFDGIITSVTIIKQVVLRKLSCYEPPLIIDTSYLNSSNDVITTVNTVMPINTLLFYEN